MNKQSYRFALLGVCIMLVTTVVDYVCCGEDRFMTYRNWFSLWPLLLSELLLALVFIGNIGKLKEKSSPMRIAVTAILPIYFLYALVMSLLGHCSSISVTKLAVIQVIVAVFVLVIVVLAEMTSDLIAEKAVKTAIANSSRKDFLMTVQEIVENLKERPEIYNSLNKQCEQLVDAAKYAADTVPGGEKCDDEVGDKLAELQKASVANESTAESISSIFTQVMRAFRKRESMMKSLR